MCIHPRIHPGMWGTRNTIQRSQARVREAEVQNASSARETSASIPIGDIIMLDFDHHLDTVLSNFDLHLSLEGSLLQTVDFSKIDTYLQKRCKYSPLSAHTIRLRWRASCHKIRYEKLDGSCSPCDPCSRDESLGPLLRVFPA